MPLLLAGCGGGSDGPLLAVPFEIVGPPALEQGRCPDVSEVSVPQPPAFPDGAPANVRLTYLNPGVTGEDRVLCDVVLPYETGETRPVVAIPTADATVVDMAIEFFDDSGTLLASGLITGVDLDAAIADPDALTRVQVPVRPTRQFACAAGGRASTGRAFHSATKLPNGEVLLAGGVRADLTGASDLVDVDAGFGLFATNTIEIYDPSTGAFTALSAPELTPRAMHEAYVLNGSNAGMVHIALVGGIALDPMAADPNGPALLADQEEFRLGPTLDVNLNTPIDIITYMPGPGTVTVAQAGFTTSPLATALDPASKGPDTAPIIAGGRTVTIDMVTMMPVVNALAGVATADPAMFEPSGSGMGATGRYGATLTEISTDTAILWGGQVQLPLAQQFAQSGDGISPIVPGATPSVSQLNVGMAMPTPRAFHSAARIPGAMPGGPDDVLVVGGFDITGNQVLEPAPVFAETITPGPTAAITPVDSNDATPAGYVGLATLLDGQVLITGGTPSNQDERCTDSATLNGADCAIADALVFDSETRQLAKLPDLAVGRYGHRVTVLDDGTALITGGLHRDAAGSLRVLADAEVFDARSASADILAPDVTRDPAQPLSSTDGEPVRACAVVVDSAVTETDAPAE